MFLLNLFLLCCNQTSLDIQLVRHLVLSSINNSHFLLSQYFCIKYFVRTQSRIVLALFKMQIKSLYFDPYFYTFPQTGLTFAKLSSSWLVQPSSAELRLALILVITPTPTLTLEWNGRNNYNTSFWVSKIDDQWRIFFTFWNILFSYF